VDDDFVFDGGRVCLDLVNTVRERYLGGRDLLTGPAELARWLVAAGLSDRRPRVTAAWLAEFVALREAIDAVVTGRATPEAVRLLNAAAGRAPVPVPQLRLRAGAVERATPRPADPVAAALVRIAADAIDVATDGTLIRECGAGDCSLRFADHSQKRNRQWCSMARCGNRVKARAHYARIRKGGTAGTTESGRPGNAPGHGPP
jgi:predicted RNA-binding Zn ribbon-like protein